ncbi:MAG: tetratricopeptide repeat protein, partial [Bifidobacteriaceae bacterium]|nr:tetratricopeptide repeat protein [Bifidobacteriaceae bacterium]
MSDDAATALPGASANSSDGLPPTRFRRFSVAETWEQLKQHLEWTEDLPTVAMVAFENPADEATLRHEAERLATDHGWEWTFHAADSFREWSWTHLPCDGLLWVELIRNPLETGLEALHGFQEMRSRLHLPGAGPVVIAVTPGLMDLAGRETFDLWSVVSFACTVRGTAAADRSLAAAREWQATFTGGPDGHRPATQLPPSATAQPVVTLPKEYRTDFARRLIPVLAKTYRDLPTDVDAAKTDLDAIDSIPAGHPRDTDRPSWVLYYLARAAVAFQQEMPADLSQALSESLAQTDALAATDPPCAAQLLNAIILVALATDCDEATNDAVKQLGHLAESPVHSIANVIAKSLDSSATGLEQMGYQNPATKNAHCAVEIREGLAKANPAAYLPDLAMSLNNYAIRLSEVGQREEALAPARRAVEIREGLAKTYPAAYLPGLAASLNNWAVILWGVGQPKEALGLARRAVEAYEGLAKANPAAYLPYLAGSLNNYAMFLSEVGQHQEALDPARRAVEAYEGLAETNPAAYLP